MTSCFDSLLLKYCLQAERSQVKRRQIGLACTYQTFLVIDELIKKRFLSFLSVSTGNSVNTLVPTSQLLATALGVAKEITSNSPDAVQSTKHALLLSQQLDHHSGFMMHASSNFSNRVYQGKNIKVSQQMIVCAPVHLPC